MQNDFRNTLCEISLQMLETDSMRSVRDCPSHARPFEPQSEVIFGRFRQLLAINAHQMAPRTSKRLQEPAWNDPTKGLLRNTAGTHLPKLLEEGGVVRIREQLHALVPVAHLHTTGKLVSGLDQS